MNKTIKDEVWYCENSKGHKIAPYGTNYHVPKPRKRITFEVILNFIGTLIGLTLVGSLIYVLMVTVS